jgi:hypothetical protein
MWQHYWPMYDVLWPYPKYVYKIIFLPLACAESGIYKQYKKHFNHFFEFHKKNHNKLIDYPYVEIRDFFKHI